MGDGGLLYPSYDPVNDHSTMMTKNETNKFPYKIGWQKLHKSLKKIAKQESLFVFWLINNIVQ